MGVYTTCEAAPRSPLSDANLADLTNGASSVDPVLVTDLDVHVGQRDDRTLLSTLRCSACECVRVTVAGASVMP